MIESIDVPVDRSAGYYRQSTLVAMRQWLVDLCCGMCCGTAFSDDSLIFDFLIF